MHGEREVRLLDCPVAAPNREGAIETALHYLSTAHPPVPARNARIARNAPENSDAQKE